MTHQKWCRRRPALPKTHGHRIAAASQCSSPAHQSRSSSDLQQTVCYQLGERKTKVSCVCGQLKDALPPATFLLQ